MTVRYLSLLSAVFLILGTSQIAVSQGPGSPTNHSCRESFSANCNEKAIGCLWYMGPPTSNVCYWCDGTAVFTSADICTWEWGMTCPFPAGGPGLGVPCGTRWSATCAKIGVTYSCTTTATSTGNDCVFQNGCKN